MDQNTKIKLLETDKDVDKDIKNRIKEMDRDIKNKLEKINDLTSTSTITATFLQTFYPKDVSQEDKKTIRLIVTMILSEYLQSVEALVDKIKEMSRQMHEKNRQMHEKDRRMHEKDMQMCEKNRQMCEKDRQMCEKNRQMCEKDRQMCEKDRQINEKDRQIEKYKFIKAAMGSDGFDGAIHEMSRPQRGRKWGSITRTLAWKRLEVENLIEAKPVVPILDYPHRCSLYSKLNALKTRSWEAEIDMCPHIVSAMKDSLYKDEMNTLVVETHNHNDFHADISIAEHEDGRLPYSLRYFIKLKLPKTSLRSHERCGQLLNYFHVAREKQPHRSTFVGILSNLDKAVVYVAIYDDEIGIRIQEYTYDSLADALIYADLTSKSQIYTVLPTLDAKLESNFSVLAVRHHYFLLSVTKLPESGVTQRGISWGVYTPPVRHLEEKPQFVLKITHDNTLLAHEREILQKFIGDPSPYVPELVWTCEGNTQLGITPIGRPVRPGQPADISRKIVEGLIEGLRYLHGLQIVHRDIRLSNLILKGTDADNITLVIIDYETAYDMGFNRGDPEVTYEGGRICWPRRLLQTVTKLYVPEPEDDLFASILVILHLLFPGQFDEFNVRNIQLADNPSEETVKLLRTWERIEKSTIWGQFYEAAKGKQYDNLLEMADFFCL